MDPNPITDKTTRQSEVRSTAEFSSGTYAARVWFEDPLVLTEDEPRQTFFAYHASSEVDWVYADLNRAMSVAEVLDTVTALRAAGVGFRDHVPG